MKRHKFGVGDKARRTVDGIVFHSIAESKRYGELKLLAAAGEISDLELQPKFEWQTTYSANERRMWAKHFYRADFAYINVAGERIIEDVKGFKTREYKRKKKIVESLYRVEIIEI